MRQNTVLFFAAPAEACATHDSRVPELLDIDNICKLFMSYGICFEK